MKKTHQSKKRITLNGVFNEYQENQKARELKQATIVRTIQNFKKLKPIIKQRYALKKTKYSTQYLFSIILTNRF